MPGWLGIDAPNIAKGWAPEPQLQAANIGELVKSILANRLARDKMTQENIADTIKNLQEQRQSQAYLEAAQQAGLLEGVDTEKLGALGVKGASTLAEQIRRKQEADARAEHLGALTAHVGSGRGGGSGSGSEYPETTWDDQGREWRKGPAGRWIPVKPVTPPKDPSQIQPTRAERANAAPTIPGLTVYPDDTAVPLPPDIPSAPDAAPTSPPADKNLVPGYGVPTTADGTGEARVKVKSPDGKVDTLPASQLQDAIDQGFTVVQ